MKKLLLVYTALLLSYTGFASKLVELTPDVYDFALRGSYLDIFEDTSGLLTIENIKDASFKGFKPNLEINVFNKNATSTYWIKFQVINRSEKGRFYFLETHSPHTDLMEVYASDENGNYTIKKGGGHFSFSEREYVNKNLIFGLPFNSNNSVHTFYIKIKSRNYSEFKYRIKSANYFIYYITNEYYFLGLYYGVLLIMALYNALLFITIREKVYLFYVVYVLGAILITMTDDGLGFQYLWPNNPEWSRFIGYHFAPLFYLSTFIFYAIRFLGLKTTFSRYKVIIERTLIGYLLYYMVMNIFSLPVFPILYVVPFAVTYFISWKVFLRGYKAARLFLTGFTLILISIIILQLRAEHIIHGNLFTVYILNFGHLIDVVLFSFALADKFRIVKKEKEKAQKEIIIKLEENKVLQEKVNKELEQKVRERTDELTQKNEELSKANDQLKVLNDTINQMNARLDYDNWYLKKDISEQIKARVIDSEVPYNKFNEVFPDETACYRYLEELKWKDGFTCKKCGNVKFSLAGNPFARKCSRCGNVESVTAYTIFHGIKFPINKAFYLTYIVHRKGNTITSEELSKQLEIGRNTAWKFKKKVLEEVDLFKKKNKNKPLDSWEEILL